MSLFCRYQQYEEEDTQTTLLEREISTQPKYNTIVRTTLPPEEPTTRPPLFKIYTLQTDTPSTPESTPVLAAQIASLLHSLNSSGIEDSDIETEPPVAETDEPTTVSTTTSTTTTTRAPPLRRTTAARRRGVTVKTTPALSSTTQVSPRNYTIVRRRRPLRRPNEITSGSDDSNDLSRKIRSTTPDSREVNGVNETVPRRFGGRIQRTRFRVADSVPAAASPVVSGQPSSNDDEEVPLTTVQVEPKFVQRQRFNLRTNRRFPRPSTSSGVDSDTVPDSDVSAATVEARRPTLVARGRNRFTLSSTTEAALRSTIAATLTPRRPTFGRFSARPFTRPPPSPADVDADSTIETMTQRSTLRLPLSRTRPTPAVVGRKLPFPYRQSTTQQVLVNSDNDEDDDEPETRVDDILLSESARAEKEHDEPETDIDEELPKRRVVIKKLRPTTINPANEVISTEIVPIDTDNADTGKKRFRVIRRRPTSSTTTEVSLVSSEPPTGPGVQRIRKVIRKKLRPTEINPEITNQNLNSLNTFKSSTTEVFNYGERTKPPTSTTSTEAETEPVVEEVTEFYKEEKKVVTTTVAQNIETNTDVTTQEPLTEKIIETIQEEKVHQIPVETTTNANKNTDSTQTKIDSSEIVEVKSDIITGDLPNNEQTKDIETKPEEEIKNVTSENGQKINNEKPEVTTENKVEVAIATDEKGIDISDSKETDTESLVTEITTPETITTSTTVLTSTTARSRLPYRPRKKLFTPSTESSVPSTSKTFSRKYNPGAYTSPATVDRPQFRPSGAVTRRPFSSKIFTRRPFTPKTTQRVEEEEEEEYNDEEVEEHEQENPFVFVPPNQLFTRKPESTEEDDEDNSEELLEEGEGDENYEEEDEQDSSKFSLTTKKPGLKPRVVNSSTFRTSSTTTELPKRIASSQNRTGIITRFASNKPVTDKKRVQNIPSGYNTPVNAAKPKSGVSFVNKTESTLLQNSGDKTTTVTSVTENESTTVDDDYLTATVTTVTDEKETTVSSDISTFNSIGTETVTDQMEIDDNTDDYLEFSERTTNYPTTQDIITFTQTEPEFKTTIVQNTVTNTAPYTEASVEQQSTFITTTAAPSATPIIKTQFNKLFSISRVVEVNSKLDKHRLNKNNQTTLIEEGQILVEKKPVIDKIGEVSRYSLIKIVEDEIPIYLTKFGHIYPVEHPPDNIIRIDEARNARALNGNAQDIPKENLVASESVNEGYRHVKDVSSSKDQDLKSHVVHVPNDQFLSYINDDKKNNKDWENPSFDQWQFVPAAYENEKIRAAKSFEVITPRTMHTNPSTLPLEGLFKTDIQSINQKANNEQNEQFFVYSSATENQKESENIGKLPVLESDNGPTILTFAKGQESSRASVKEEIAPRDLLNGPIYTGNYVSSTLSTPVTTFSDISQTTTTITETATSPILDLLTTTESTKVTTESFTTTEAIVDDTTTTNTSPVDTRRSKFSFSRRPIIKSSNFTRPSIAPRTVKKINAAVISNLSPKTNKTSFSPSKSRFTATRAQNVPVDLKKKIITSKAVPRTFSTNKVYTTETPRSTTERKLYFKPNRPSFRPSFLPRKTTPATTTGDT